jgi:hypothetical protein
VPVRCGFGCTTARRLLRFASGGGGARLWLLSTPSAVGSRPRSHFSQGLSHLHDVIGLDEELRDRPARRRRDLGVDLVGRDLDDRLALLDLVAFGDVPLEDRALGDRLAHLGHDDLNGFTVGSLRLRIRRGTIPVRRRRRLLLLFLLL